MGQLDEVLSGLRSRLDKDIEVPDVAAAVDAMARAYRNAAVEADSLSGSAVARLLGITRQAVNQRAARGSLLVVADCDGVRYPAWQFRDGQSLRGLIGVVRAARSAGVDDAALADWIERDRRRLDLLVSGRADVLTDQVAQARRPRTQISRRRSTGRAPRLSDTRLG